MKWNVPLVADSDGGCCCTPAYRKIACISNTHGPMSVSYGFGLTETDRNTPKERFLSVFLLIESVPSNTKVPQNETFRSLQENVRPLW